MQLSSFYSNHNCFELFNCIALTNVCTTLQSTLIQKNSFELENQFFASLEAQVVPRVRPMFTRCLGHQKCVEGNGHYTSAVTSSLGWFEGSIHNLTSSTSLWTRHKPYIQQKSQNTSPVRSSFYLYFDVEFCWNFDFK